MTKDKIFDINKLRRVTTSSKVIPEIDGLRFLAIFSVVILHLRTHMIRTTPWQLSSDGLSSFLNSFISNGGFGVNVFFGISGFILALPFANQYLSAGRKVNLKAYYIRRLTRLEPPYFIIMTILLVANIIFLNNSLRSLMPHFIASLTYSHFFIYGKWSIINPVAWSLETEVQFYLLAPILFMIFKVNNKWFRRCMISLIILAFTFLLLRFIQIYVDLNLIKSLLAYLPYFSVGVLFADFYLNYLQGSSLKRNYLWDAVGIVSTFTIFWLNPHSNFIYGVINLVGLFLVFVSTFKGKLLNRFYTTKFIYITGGMCYTIYLIHYAFIAFIMEYTSKIGFEGNLLLNLLVQAVIVLPLLFLLSSTFFLLFEKPFMYKDWPARLVSVFSKSKCK